MSHDADDDARPKAVIFDVDGTLCDVRSIRHLVEAPAGVVKFKRQFDRFHASSIDCPAHPAVVELARRARGADFAVLVVTGREEKWSFLTLTWLAENRIEFDQLFMRKRGDFRPDVEVKREIERRIARTFRPVLAVDDRPEVARVWAESGIATAMVEDWGSIAPIVWPAAGTDGRVVKLMKGLPNL